MRSAALLVVVGLSLVALAGFALAGGSGAHAQVTTTIRIGDNWFCDPSGPQPCSQPHDTIISAGDTIVWEWGPGGAGTVAPHTTTHCADDFTTCSGPRDWDSSPATTAGTFSHTFDTPGAFVYRCQIHPSTMRGTVTVLAAEPSPSPPTPTPTPTPQPSPQPTPQPSPATVTPAPAAVQPAAVPTGGGEPPADGGASALWWGAIAAGGLLVAVAAVRLRGLRR